jgi:nicotinamide-nucleotide amidase
VTSPEPIETARRLLRLATDRSLTIAVAESLTGGRLAAALTAPPGASAVFRGSVTAYATDLKASVLGVDAALLAEVGAVHPEVARQMARGVRQLCRADIGIATTGVAGPEPRDGHQVGTVYLAVASAGAVESKRLSLQGRRARIQLESTDAALRLAISCLSKWASI